MEEELVRAYLAGVLDSDGFISIKRHAANTRYKDSYTFSEWAGVGQVSPAAVELFAERWGGVVHLRKHKNDDGGDWRPMHYWVVSNKIAATCVGALRPHIRIKARQADLVLALRASKNRPQCEQRTFKGTAPRSMRLDPEIVAVREAAWREVRSLNEKRRFNV